MLKALISRVTHKDPRLDQLDKMAGEVRNYSHTLKDFELGRSILKAPPSEQREWVLAMIVWLDNHRSNPNNSAAWRRHYALRAPMLDLLRRKLPFEDDDIIALLEWSAQ